jgi:menaquinone-dependent protoporphyrinogen oxidase
MRVLIVYGSRYGATAGTSEEIAKILREEGFTVNIVNAKQEKVNDISDYELVIIGSGTQMDKWTGEAEDFLKKFQKDLAKKKVALFVSSGVQPILKHEGNKEEMDGAWKKYLEDKAAKYSLKPIALGLFGGVLDYNQMGFLARKTLGSFKERLEAAGFKETKPGVYDTRDWSEIRNWAKTLVLKARYLGS